jgi:hypothetical protein
MILVFGWRNAVMSTTGGVRPPHLSWSVEPLVPDMQRPDRTTTFALCRYKVGYNDSQVCARLLIRVI